MIWYSHLFKNFPQFIVIHTVKGETIVGRKITVRCLSVPEGRTFFLGILACVLKEHFLGEEVTEASGSLDESGAKFPMLHVLHGI